MIQINNTPKNELTKEQRDSIKLACLEKYATRAPKPFYQFDVIFDIGSSEDFIQSDKDGDDISAKATYELIRGAEVRVLISPNITSDQVARALKKIRKMIKADGFGSLKIEPEQHEETYADEVPHFASWE